MPAPGQIDPTSAYFASLAAQASGMQPGSKSGVLNKAEKNRASRFARILEKQQETGENTELPELPPELASLPEDKILPALLDGVSAAGDALQERPVPDNIVRYKEAVRNFIRFIVARSFQVETSEGLRIRKGLEIRQKQYTQIHVIDEKLEKLAASILANQRDRLTILAKVEEIKGLLVDLLS